MTSFLKKNQSLILSLFYTNPRKTYHMQEIGRILGKSPGVFQRTLNGLVEKGYLRSEYRANFRLFQANTSHPFYPELRKIVTKTGGVEGRLKSLVDGIKTISAAFIFGSFAKGVERDTSDIDLFIIGPRSVENDLLKQIPAIEREIQREINYKLLNDEEFHQKKRRDPFIKEILGNKVIVLKGKTP